MGVARLRDKSSATVKVVCYTRFDEQQRDALFAKMADTTERIRIGVVFWDSKCFNFTMEKESRMLISAPCLFLCIRDSMDFTPNK